MEQVKIRAAIQWTSKSEQQPKGAVGHTTEWTNLVGTATEWIVESEQQLNQD